MAVQAEKSSQPTAQSAQIVQFTRPHAPGALPFDFFRFFSRADIIVTGQNILDERVTNNRDVQRVMVEFSRSLQNSSQGGAVNLKVNKDGTIQSQLITGVICDVRFDAGKNPAVLDYMKRALTAAQFTNAPVSFAWGELFVMVPPNSTIESMENLYQRNTSDITPERAESARRAITGIKAVRARYKTLMELKS